MPAATVKTALRLVLMPGLDGTGVLFGPLLSVLQPSWRCVVVRYPRDVAACYEDLLQVVESFLPADGPFVLVAESFSGPLAMMLAALQPRGLCGVVMVASFARSPLPRAASLLLPLVRTTMAHMAPPRVAIKAMLLGFGAPAELVALVRHAITSVPGAVLAQRISVIDKVDVTSLGSRIEVPVLYLRAQGDRLVGAEAATTVQRCIAGTTVKELPGPHLLLQRNSDAAGQAIADFCRTLG